MSKIQLPISPRPKKRQRNEEPVENTVETQYKFSCAMLNLSDDIVPIIKYWVKKNVPYESVHVNEDTGMEGYEDTPHVTAKYGIHDVTPDRLKEIIRGYGPVKLSFGTVTRFIDNPKFDVLKIDMGGDKLTKMNQIISDNMECTDTYEYKPHSTLAYIKKGSCTELDGDDFFTDLNDLVSEIYFTSRDGTEHYIEL